MGEAGSNRLGWKLIAEHSAVQPDQLPLIGPSWALGRATDNAVVVAHDAVSRHHALIVRENDNFRLSDVGSRNGTYVNGKIVHGSHILAHRDLIGLGEIRPHLRFVDDHAIADPVRGQPAFGDDQTRLLYDDRRLRFTLYDRPIDLSPDEFRLLCHLHRFSGIICARTECADAIWGADAHRREDGLDRIAEGLREKLERLDPEITIIQTRITGGFLLQV